MSKLDIFLAITGGTFVLAVYIYGKITGDFWYGIRWDNIFRMIREWWKNRK